MVGLIRRNLLTLRRLSLFPHDDSQAPPPRRVSLSPPDAGVRLPTGGTLGETLAEVLRFRDIRLFDARHELLLINYERFHYCL
jgi:hypothetical protein